jgi:hypothetical protein
MPLFIRLLNQKAGTITSQIIIFLSLLTIVEPSISEVYCGRYPEIYQTVPSGRRFKGCLFSTKYNNNGVVYIIGTPNSEGDTLYKGKSGDAILESHSYDRNSNAPIRTYGTWSQIGQEYLFQFSSGLKIYIPK